MAREMLYIRVATAVDSIGRSYVSVYVSMLPFIHVGLLFLTPGAHMVTPVPPKRSPHGSRGSRPPFYSTDRLA